MARDRVYDNDFEGYAAMDSTFYTVGQLMELSEEGLISELPISGDATAARRDWK